MQEYYRDTWAEIDLDAITHNVKQIKDLHPTKEIFAVVKAKTSEKPFKFWVFKGYFTH